MNMSGQGHFLFALAEDDNPPCETVYRRDDQDGNVLELRQIGTKLRPIDIDWDHFLSEAHLYAEEVEARNAETTASERD